MPGILFDVLFWLAVAACAVAQYYILRAVLRPTLEPPASAAMLPRPHRALEIAWAILPALLLGAVFWLAWRHMHGAATAPDLRGVPVVQGPQAAAAPLLS